MEGAVRVSFLVLLAAAVLGATLGEAADEGASSVLHGCVTKHGEIAIVGPRDGCKADATPQRWSLQAPMGEQGARGVPGHWAVLEALNGRPCTTPGGTTGMIVEVRYYDTRGRPTLRCRAPGGRFIDHGDQTLTDTQTGLTWEKKVAGGNWSATCLTEPHGVGSACTWEHATDEWLDLLNGWCDSCATAGGFAGYNDWRLPTLDELMTIVDANQTPVIDPAFGETDGRDYWSASRDDAVGPPAAMAVNFFNGGPVHFPTIYPLRVRAVRGKFWQSTLQEGMDRGPH
jgi:Protein of unknown function (DUF1566)